MRVIPFNRFSILVFLGLISLTNAQPTRDSENCLMCHQLSFFSLFSQEGTFRSLEVSPVLYAHSIHARIDCRDCYADESRMVNFDVNITRVPGYNNHFYGKALRCDMAFVANCADCHLPESRFPWSKLKFSNARIDEMTHSAVIGIVLKYEPFHLPPIYE